MTERTMAERYVALRPSHWNTRDHREYLLFPKYRRCEKYLRARWIRFGRNITYEIVEAWANKQGFTETGRVVDTGCRNLAEVREVALTYFA